MNFEQFVAENNNTARKQEDWFNDDFKELLNSLKSTHINSIQELTDYIISIDTNLPHRLFGVGSIFGQKDVPQVYRKKFLNELMLKTNTSKDDVFSACICKELRIFERFGVTHNLHDALVNTSLFQLNNIYNALYNTDISVKELQKVLYKKLNGPNLTRDEAYLFWFDKEKEHWQFNADKFEGFYNQLKLRKKVSKEANDLFGSFL